MKSCTKKYIVFKSILNLLYTTNHVGFNQRFEREKDENVQIYVCVLLHFLLKAAAFPLTAVPSKLSKRQ